MIYGLWNEPDPFIREVGPKIPLEVLRRLPEYFPQAAYIFPLDPSFGRL